MKGRIIKVETAGDGFGYEVTIYVNAQSFKYPSNLNLNREHPQDYVEGQEEYRNSEEGKAQLKEIRQLESSISLGRVEIKYLDK